MSTAAELITPKTACDRRTLTVDDFTKSISPYPFAST